MANPSYGWDLVPVFGIWYARPGVPLQGVNQVRFTIEQRVQRVDGRVIYPGPISSTVTVGNQSQQDANVREAVHDAYKALAEADADDRSEAFDEQAWEAQWELDLQGAVFTSFPASDDPEIVQTGYQVKVEEMFSDLSGKVYYIEPLLEHLSQPVPGINLGLVIVPPGAPTAPAPVFAKGIAGGVAALDADGDVLNAAGAKLWPYGDGPLYALAGHSAPVGSETPVATFTDVETFEAEVDPERAGERCRLAGWPFTAGVSVLQAVALYDGSMEWAVV